MGITKYNNIDKVIFSIFAILLITTIISSLIMYNVRVSADNTQSATASVNVNAACTMSTTGNIDPSSGSGSDSASSSNTNTHTATLTPGTWTSEIGTSNVNATCNDPAGFAIYAIGYSDNTYGNTNLINNADTNNPITIPTGTATSGNTSSWSMKLGNGNGTGTGDSVSIVNPYNDYSSIPDVYTKVATYPTSTTISISTSTSTNTNTTSTTTGQAGTSLTTTYGVYVSPTQTPGTYKGAVRYTLVHPSSAIPQNKYYMQDLDIGTCEVLGHDNNFTVYDKRDEKDYTVRYINGQCWMTQNLAIEPGTHMTAYDTNITPDQYNNDGYFALPGEGYDLRVDGKPVGAEVDGKVSTGNCYSVAGYNNACSHIVNSVDVDETGGLYTVEQLGAWYNYAATTAGTITGTLSQVSESDAVYDICPSGWRLPNNAGNTTGSEIYDLRTTLNASPSLMEDFHVLTGGDYQYGEHIRADNVGLWWSSTAAGDSNGRYRLFYSADIHRLDIFSTITSAVYVRCILDE